MKNILDEIKHEMGASNAEDAEFLEMAEYFDSLDAEDIDNLDDAEAAEYADYMDALEMAERKHGKLRVRAAKHHHTKHKPKKKSSLGKVPKLGATGGGGRWAKKDTVNTKAPAFGSPSYINQMMTQSVGDLNITVTRATANITSPLPVVLFGLQGLASNFASMIKQFLPANTTLVCSTDTNGDILFTYTNSVGPVTDVIRVTLTGSQISYSEFLQSMNQNYFKTRYIRQEYVNDANLLNAVSQPINFGLLSALGAKNQNTLLPRSRRLNSDFQTFIVNVFLPLQKITSDFSFVQNIINVAGQTLAYDVFMAERTNLNNV